MDPDDSSISPSKYISLGLAFVWHTLEGVFNQQFLRRSPEDTKPVLPLDSPTSISPSVSSADTISLVASVASIAIPDKDTLLPVATPDNMVLPQTLLLRCFSCMDLKCLIFSRCVCSDWRRLLPHSDIHPTRRRFLELYDRMLANELFLESRTWTLDNLKPFDRHSYMATLREQCTGPEAEIPEDFEMYILEWPARMAIACMWPGLPFVDSQTDSVQRQYGINYLAPSPQLSALVFKHQFPEVCFIPALLTWRESTSTSWLMFDKTPHDRLGFTLHGCVFKMVLYSIPGCEDEVNDASIIPYDYDEDTGQDLYKEMFKGVYAKLGYQDMGTCFVYPSWVAYLEACWSEYTEPYVDPRSGKTYPIEGYDGVHPDIPLTNLVEEMGEEGYDYMDRSYQDVPAPPWTRRKEAKFQGRLVTGSVPSGRYRHVFLS